jgi:uncharacterized metal-binding protein
MEEVKKSFKKYFLKVIIGVNRLAGLLKNHQSLIFPCGGLRNVGLNKRKVEIRINRQGRMRVFLDEKEVKVLPLSEVMEETQRELNRKEVLKWKSRVHKPGCDHPWKQHYSKAENMQMAI